VSVAFDRAAEYYDQTRGVPAEVERQMVELVANEARGRGRVLEVGVGTGRTGVPLRRAGLDLFGVDLSMPMLRKLMEKVHGAALLPAIQADGTALPFADHAFGASLAVHVLHLVGPWRKAADEMMRVTRPGGVLIVTGGGGKGRLQEVSEHFFAQGPRTGRPYGLVEWAELDAHLGITPRVLGPVVGIQRTTVEEHLQNLERGIFAGCWEMDDASRRRSAAATRAWARARWGDLGAPRADRIERPWRAYDLPA
jgi:SAM-dependent methyltransferase